MHHRDLVAARGPLCRAHIRGSIFPSASGEGIGNARSSRKPHDLPVRLQFPDVACDEDPVDRVDMERDRSSNTVAIVAMTLPPRRPAQAGSQRDLRSTDDPASSLWTEAMPAHHRRPWTAAPTRATSLRKLRIPRKPAAPALRTEGPIERGSHQNYRSVWPSTRRYETRSLLVVPRQSR